MPTRQPLLDGLAKVTATPVTKVAHASRQMNNAAGIYGTAIPTSKRYDDLPIGYGLSVLLALAVDSPKEAAKLVPALGNLRAQKLGYFFGVMPPDESERRHGLSLAFDAKITQRLGPVYRPGATLFEALIHVGLDMANNWEGFHHLALRTVHFEVELSLAPNLGATIRWPDFANLNSSHYHEASFMSGNRRQTKSGTSFGRKVIIPLAPFEMLAALYRPMATQGSAQSDLLNPPDEPAKEKDAAPPQGNVLSNLGHASDGIIPKPHKPDNASGREKSQPRSRERDRSPLPRRTINDERTARLHADAACA